MNKRPLPKQPTAIYWDYENIPFHRNNWRKFVSAIQEFMKQIPVVCAKCFYRDSVVSDDDRDLFQLIQRLKLKKVIGSQPNAVDNVLIQSCRSTISSDSTIRQVLIISGDGDYLPLVKFLQQKNIHVAVICMAKTGNLHLRQSVTAFTYETLIARPLTWWQESQILHIPTRPETKTKIRPKLKKYDDEDPYADEDDEDQWEIIDDGDLDVAGYDLDEPIPFDDDEEKEEDEMVYDDYEQDNSHYHEDDDFWY